MVWDHLSINRPHVAYCILGGFTSIFMLVSLFIKEKLYIGEATVATICGIIFGPIGAKWFVPEDWGNVDQITLEASRIVLVVQCFAVGVELPKRYMTRHWKSIVLLLIPVMTWGWLVTSLFIWWMIPTLSWLESLACAACVTATDPVLASSVVGKGKFAKRVPKHLRDLLSAESGCNDGMAFPFIYLSLYLIKYRPDANEVALHWFCVTILYECVFGAIYGVAIGYIGRHAIKFAERKNLIDRESFLVFYFVLALWCAGTGALLGLDDLLVGFCCGVAFSNDGWFSQKTEESHVSNVIDLLLNLAFFVYFGAIIPWSSFDRPDWGITPWRLVVIAIFVILFRRIPIMVALKPIIPDIKTWREALFAGHFGPIGVGAIFVAILARAELETGEPTPLAVLPPPGSTNYLIIELIWPITTFLILASIIIHGSSIAVFTLGKRINTMRITMSFTTANEEPHWMNRLPRLTPKTSMSIRKPDTDESSTSMDGIPTNFLARRREGDDSDVPSRPSSVHTKRHSHHGPGGPITDSAIHPRRARSDPLFNSEEFNEKQASLSLSPEAESGTTAVETTGDNEPNQKPGEKPSSPAPGHAGEDDQDRVPPAGTTAFQEGQDIIYENREGDVIGKGKIPNATAHRFIPRKLERILNPHAKSQEPPHTVTDEVSAMSAARDDHPHGSRERRAAWAYRFDDNVIVEDADGEVIRRYKIPKEATKPESPSALATWANKVLPKAIVPSFLSNPRNLTSVATDDDSDARTVYSFKEGKSKKGINWRMHDEKGRQLNKHEFLKQLNKMDPHARAALASPGTSMQMNEEDLARQIRRQAGANDNRGLPERPAGAAAKSAGGAEDVGDADGTGETAAERKRREAALGLTKGEEDDSDDEGQAGRLEAPKDTTRRTPEIRFVERKGKGKQE